MRVERFDAGFGSGEMAFAEPHPLLRGHVGRYVGYAERTSFARRREAPSGRLPLIINLGPPLLLVDARAQTAHAHELGFVAGMSDAAAIVDSGGEQAGLQVDFTPIGAQLFLGMPLADLTNRVVPLQELFGARAAAVVERLRAEPTWEGRFRLLDALIGTRFAASPEVPPDLVWAWRRLAETRGRLGVGPLAAELGCSRKHLATRFATHIGLPPKTVGRILRFDGVIEALRADPHGTLSLAELAGRCGYYDQAHLNRDFREFAGITPSEHRRRSLAGLGVVAD